MRLSAARWAELVSAWEASGQSARAYAEQRGVSESSLRWWKGELARRARREPARRSPGPGRHRDRAVVLARVVRTGAHESALGTASSSSVVLAVGQVQILVRREFDAQFLRAVVQALSERP